MQSRKGFGHFTGARSLNILLDSLRPGVILLLRYPLQHVDCCEDILENGVEESMLRCKMSEEKKMRKKEEREKKMSRKQTTKLKEKRCSIKFNSNALIDTDRIRYDEQRLKSFLSIPLVSLKALKTDPSVLWISPRSALHFAGGLPHLRQCNSSA